MDFKEKYLNTFKVAEKIRSNSLSTAEEIGHANWLLETCRGDEISVRIAKKYPLNSQIAILMDKDIKFTEWCEYQSYRAQVKIEVDNEISAFEAEINHGA